MTSEEGPTNETEDHRTTRRRFVEFSGAITFTSVTGCLSTPSADSTDSSDSSDSTEKAEASEADATRRFGPDSTLFATWRGQDPATAITLQWLTDAATMPAPRTVELSPIEGGSDHQTKTGVVRFGAESLDRLGGDGLYRHRAELTELEPATRYRIDVANSDHSSVVETTPDTVTEPFTFAEGGDIGTSFAVSHLHEQAASWGPRFGVVGGDLAYANGTDEIRWVRFLETWHEKMRVGERLIPLVAAIGNHEVQGRMHGDPDDAPFFYTLFDNVVRERAYWALNIGDFLSILLLDSNHTTPVPGEQTEWLAEALAQREHVTHVLPVYHVPAYPSAKPLNARDRGDVREHWVPLFEQYDVDVCFEHDDHTYKRTHPLRDGQPVDSGGVRYVGDGAWGRGPREVKSESERPYLQRAASSLNVIRVTLTPDGDKQFLAVDPDGEKIDQFEV